MRDLALMAQALSDENRLRALCVLSRGELCLCQIIDLLGLAPSTVSKHMDLLHRVGLVQRRKEGRWHYFRLAGPRSPLAVRQALRWALAALKEDATALADQRRLALVLKKDLGKLCLCYRPC